MKSWDIVEEQALLLVNSEWKISHYALTMLVPNSIAAKVGSLTLEADK